jgi:alpha-L-fucosidase
MAHGRSDSGMDRREVLKFMGAGGLITALSGDSLWSQSAGGAPEAAGQHAPNGERASHIRWYGQDLVRGHISWLHPAWTRPEKDFNTIRWIDQFERAGFRSFVFYSKFHDGVCNWPSRLQDLKPERDFVGEITAEAHRRGIRVIIYYSAGPDEWAAERHPDWRCVRRNGSVAGKRAPGYERWFKFPHCCPNSPYREYAMGQIEEILSNYDADGFWLDVMSFPDIDSAAPELGHLGCFCKWCREKYSRITGGGSLFDIDGTPHQRKWEADSYREFFDAAKQIVRQKGTDRSITYNGCGHLEPPYYWPELEAMGDYLSMEGFHFAQVQIGPQCRLARSAGKPYEIICVASGQTIGWTPKSSDLILLEAATVTAHGGTYCCAMDPTASGKIFENQIDQIGAASAYLHAREKWFTNTKAAYDAAVFAPSYLAHLPPDADATRLTEMSHGWPDLLDQRNIPYAYLYPNSEISSFQLLILDGSFPVSDRTVEQVKSYVEQGGSILAELRPPQLDSSAGEELLREVLGIRIVGPTGYEAVYLDRLDKSIAQGMTAMPTLVGGPSYRVRLTSASPLAYYTYPIAPWSLSRMTFAFHNPPSETPSADPAITLNRIGRGQAIFVACSLGTHEIRRHQNILSDPETDLPQVHEFALQLGYNLALRLVPEPILRSEVPAGVSIVVNEQDGRYIVHLLNNLLDPMLFSDNRTGLLKLASLKFGLNQRRTGSVRRAATVSGQELQIQRNGKWAAVTVPELNVHEAVVFEHV